jgi:hypothetical protein
LGSTLKSVELGAAFFPLPQWADETEEPFIGVGPPARGGGIEGDGGYVDVLHGSIQEPRCLCSPDAVLGSRRLIARRLFAQREAHACIAAGHVDYGAVNGRVEPMAFKERVFSGVQPTGNLHLGNYLGAIVKFVALQESYNCIYCVVDMHAITVWQEPAELSHATREVTAAFLACGIDPNKHIVFNQSQVAEHAELAWVFNCIARLGWLNRMTQFKEKAGKDRENVSVGLYAYPNLMAADILVYRATHVPVGEDQKQHLELSR